LVDEHELLQRIVEARGGEHRAALLLQRRLAMRAARFDERTAAKVATASTSVPAPVTNEEIVAQSVARNSITISRPRTSSRL
jgi:hypothetical protein